MVTVTKQVLLFLLVIFNIATLCMECMEKIKPSKSTSLSNEKIISIISAFEHLIKTSDDYELDIFKKYLISKEK